MYTCVIKNKGTSPSSKIVIPLLPLLLHCPLNMRVYRNEFVYDDNFHFNFGNNNFLLYQLKSESILKAQWFIVFWTNIK